MLKSDLERTLLDMPNFPHNMCIKLRGCFTEFYFLLVAVDAKEGVCKCTCVDGKQINTEPQGEQQYCHDSVAKRVTTNIQGA